MKFVAGFIRGLLVAVLWICVTPIASAELYTTDFGSELVPLGNCNDCSQRVAFPVFGYLRWFQSTRVFTDAVYVSSNGYAGLSSGAATNAAQQLDTQTVGAIFAPLLTDLDASDDAASRVFVNTRTLGQIVVTWVDMGRSPGDYTVRSTFQLVIRSDTFAVPANEGQIGFFYGRINDPGIAAAGYGDGLAGIAPEERATFHGPAQELSHSAPRWFNLDQDLDRFRPQTIASEVGQCQAADAGTDFPLPLVAMARTVEGAPMVGVPITFSTVPVGGADATLTGQVAVTDSTGRAAVFATAGRVTGVEYRVVARLPDQTPTIFSLINRVPGSGARACINEPLRSVIRLKSGVPIVGVTSLLANDSRRFAAEIPPAARNLVLRTSGGIGGLEVFGQFHALPRGAALSCRGMGPGTVRECDVQPELGTLHIELRGVPSFIGVEISASWTDPMGPPLSDDLNGDHIGDLLWVNEATRRSYVQLRSPTGVLVEQDLFVSSVWRVVASGDINGDERADTIWYNAATHEHLYWLMDPSGHRPALQGTLRRDANWRVTHADDFDGNGADDLVWHRPDTGQTQVWLMRRQRELVNASWIGPGDTVLTDPRWVVVATGDLNGDGKADLVWHNASSGETVYWHMSGVRRLAEGILHTGLDWRVVSAGDLDADGRADLIWHNAAMGISHWWLTDASGTGASRDGTLLVHPDWRVTGMSDVDGDLRHDLLWRNGATGETYLWLMDGSTPRQRQSLSTDPTWRLINR